MFKEYVLPWVIYFVYRLLMTTWRIQLFECEELLQDKKNNQPIIFAHWHGDEMALTHLVSYFGLSTMTSTSKDGNLIDFAINKLGGKTTKGSSTRGGVNALKGLVRLCKNGNPSSMAVDAPTGPIYKVKPGVFQLSALAKAQIYPVGVHCDRKIIFHKSWDKVYLPKPFAKINIRFEKPLPIIQKSDRENYAKLSKTLENMINDAGRRAAKAVAKPKNEMLP